MYPPSPGISAHGFEGRLLADAYLTGRRPVVSSCRPRLPPTRKHGWAPAGAASPAGSGTSCDGGALGQAVPHALHLPHRHFDEAGFVAFDGFPDRSGKGGG